MTDLQIAFRNICDTINGKLADKSKDFKFLVYPLLFRGEENSVTTKTIMQALNMSERNVVLQVRKEREHGALICNKQKDDGGYFIPKTLNELKRFYDTFNTRNKLSYLSISVPYTIVKKCDNQELFEQIVDMLESRMIRD